MSERRGGLRSSASVVRAACGQGRNVRIVGIEMREKRGGRMSEIYEKLTED